VRQPEFGANVDGRQTPNLGDVDAVMHDDDVLCGNAVLHQDVTDRARGGDEEIDLPVFPP
jgi:hypothetical protein